MPDRSALPESDPLLALRDALRTFADERDWGAFHSPKNLAMALSVEAGELLEHFQWLDGAQSASLSPEAADAVRLEMADVLLYLIRLADRLDVDLAQAARDKMVINARRYPVDKARGNSRKHDRL
jgi:dCTP diphosphatase